MWIRRASIALFLGLLLAVAGLAVPVRSADARSHVFTVSGVPVDVTAETAAAARETAHAEGHVKAMEKLLARLLPRDELGLPRPLNAAEILAYVQDFSVANERTSDVRYLSELTFRFRPEPIRELLRANGLQHAETMSKPVVVLPIFGIEGEAVLWGEANPWWAAWAARPPGGWLVPLTVPLPPDSETVPAVVVPSPQLIVAVCVSVSSPSLKVTERLTASPSFEEEPGTVTMGTSLTE